MGLVDTMIRNTKIWKETIDDEIHGSETWVYVKCPICGATIPLTHDTLKDPLSLALILSNHIYYCLLDYADREPLPPNERNKIATEWSSWVAKEIVYIINPKKKLLDTFEKIAKTVVEDKSDSVLIKIDWDGDTIKNVICYFDGGLCKCGNVAKVCDECCNKAIEKLDRVKKTLEELVKEIDG